MRQDEMQRQGSSVVRRQGTTSSRVPAVQKTRAVTTQRQSLTTAHRDQLYTQSKVRKSQDVGQQETLLLGQQPYLAQDPETWGDEKIPVYSRKKDQNFTVLALGIGMLVMIVLIMLGSMVLDAGRHWVQHIQYGDHPVTHFSATLGLPGETSEKHTYVLGVNQDGTIVIVVVPPKAGQTKQYVLPAYTPFPPDSVPYVSQTTIQGVQALRIQVDSTEWYLVRQGSAFAPAQL